MTLNPLGLAPAVRRQLVDRRWAAMCSGIDSAAWNAGNSADARDRVVSLALRCELLYLDGRDQEALAMFESSVTPVLTSLPSAQQTELLEDQADLLLSNWSIDAAHDRSRLALSRRSLLRHPRRDYRAIVLGSEASFAGEHYDAVPYLWAELRQAYAGLSWRRRRFAHADYARQMLAMGDCASAAYHAVLSQQEEVVSRVAGAAADDAGLAAVLLDRVLSASCLTRNAQHAAVLIAAAADLVPDYQVSDIAAWLAARAEQPVESLSQLACAEKVWEALRFLAPRLNAETAGRIVSLALDHPGFAANVRLRKPMLVAVNELVARLPPPEAAALVPRLLPAADDARSDYDFAEALNALCHAVTCGKDEQAKRVAREKLCPPGLPINDLYLQQVGPVLGIVWPEVEKLARYAEGVAAMVRKQVERLSPGAEPSKLGGYGTMSAETDDGSGRLAVHISGGQIHVDAVLAYADQLSPEAADGLALASAAAAADDDNIVSNRAALVRSIGRLTNRLTPAGAAACVPVLRDLAAGDFSESRASQPHAVATHPMNPIKMGFGDPADLRGLALVSLAVLAARHPEAAAALHDDCGGDLTGSLLVAGLGDSDAGVRSLACVAARKLDKLLPEEFAAVLLLTNDRDGDAAAAALSTFWKPGRLGLNRPQLGLLLSATSRAATSPNVVVRRSAARVSGGLRGIKLSRSEADRLKALVERQLVDVAASVRAAASGAEVGGE